jgi:excinuclease ABC subunit C
VCIGRRPAAYAFTAAKPPATATAAFGPVPGARKAREAVRRLNDWFRLRDCPQKQTMVFADQKELFPIALAPGCIRHEIGQCLAPCAAACTRAEYAFHVEAAVDSLNGKDHTPVEHLQREMTAAATALQFERAAVLRDRLDALEWLAKHLERLRQAVRHSFIYPVASDEGRTTWYLIRDGRVRAALPAPTNDEERQAVRWKLEEVYQGGPSMGGLPGLNEVDGVLLVAGWFRRHREERTRGIDVATRLGPPSAEARGEDR